jgi:hypothetical protein
MMVSQYDCVFYCLGLGYDALNALVVCLLLFAVLVAALLVLIRVDESAQCLLKRAGNFGLQFVDVLVVIAVVAGFDDCDFQSFLIDPCVERAFQEGRLYRQLACFQLLYDIGRGYEGRPFRGLAVLCCYQLTEPVSCVVFVRGRSDPLTS